MRRFPGSARMVVRRLGPQLRIANRFGSSFRIRNSALLGWLGVGLIIILSLVPGSNRPNSSMPGQLEHVTAYLFCSILLLRACAPEQWGARLLFLCGLAAALETVQLFVPGRTSRLIDLGSSLAGAALGFLLVAIRSRGGKFVNVPAQDGVLPP